MLLPEHAEKDDLNAEHGTKSIVALLAGLPFPAALLTAPLQSSPEKIWKHSNEAPSIIGFRPDAGRRLPRLSDRTRGCPGLDRSRTASA
jgi:hypothetical protein